MLLKIIFSSKPTFKYYEVNYGICLFAPRIVVEICDSRFCEIKMADKHLILALSIHFGTHHATSDFILQLEFAFNS